MMEHEANSAYARLPAASRPVTRRPPVGSWCQLLPASWVAHNSGPYAQPLIPSRNRISPTPVGPFGAPVFGAGAPCHVLPASLVHATDVQMFGLALAQVPGVPAWPSAQPRCVPMNVTEAGWKLGGIGPAGGVAGTAVLAWLTGLDWLGDGDGDACWLAELSG